MPTAVGILTFMSRINVKLRLNERENYWITSGAGHSLSLTSHDETIGPYLTKFQHSLDSKLTGVMSRFV